MATLDELEDEQLDELVLSNWHKLNSALKHGQSVDTLRRLLRLELSRGAAARPNIAERVRSALFRAMTQRGAVALVDAINQLAIGGHSSSNETDLVHSLMEAGLDAQDADSVVAKARESD